MVKQHHTTKNEMRNKCCGRDDHSYTHSSLQGHTVTSRLACLQLKIKNSVSTSKLSSFLQLRWFNVDIIQGGIKDLELHTNLKMKLRGWQFLLCLRKKEKKKKNHSALVAKLQYIYTWWVRPQKTIGLLVQEYSLINPDFPYNRRNTESFIPIDSISKAELSFFLHQAVVCGHSSKRTQAPGRNGDSGES